MKDSKTKTAHDMAGENSVREEEIGKPEEMDTSPKGAENKKNGTRKNGTRRKKKAVKRMAAAAILIIAAVAAVSWNQRRRNAEAAAAMSSAVQTATVSRRDLTSELTASSSLSPKDTYEVISLVEGEILEADFEEGDAVKKGQVLYRLDSADIDSNVTTAQTSLLRAQENLSAAQAEYNEAAGELSGNTYKATASGYLKNLLIKEGDRISSGTKIGELYDDSVMKLTVPFLSAEAAMIAPGNEAVITLSDTGETVSGTVSVVSAMEETLSGGRLVRSVTIEAGNPGGLTVSTQAVASVGEAVCAAEGTFVPRTETELTIRLLGNGSLTVESLLVNEGSRLETGTGIFTVTADSAEKYLKTYKDSLNSAGDNLENAENQLENTQGNLEDYTITAPISGTVVKKNSKAGDKVSRSSGESSAMAVIYDLSAMTLEMSVDELDVNKVKAGQSVEITADAVEGQVFTGEVTNVSLQGSYSNGVTNYPVTVTLNETGDLLPGMNVDAKIILDSAEQALVIPAGALMRGNRVYVKNPEKSGTEKSGQDSQEPGGRKGSEGSAVPEGFYAVEVETGIITDEYVEILSGLSEGDIVYVEAGSGSQNGSVMMFEMGGGRPGSGAMPAGGAGGPGGSRGQGGSGGPR